MSFELLAGLQCQIINRNPDNFLIFFFLDECSDHLTCCVNRKRLTFTVKFQVMNLCQGYTLFAFL